MIAIKLSYQAFFCPFWVKGTPPAKKLCFLSGIVQITSPPLPLADFPTVFFLFGYETHKNPNENKLSRAIN